MAIPWLIGGAAVAVAAVTAAVLSDDDISSDQGTDEKRAKERELKRKQTGKERAARKAEWETYATRVIRNLQKKYNLPEQDLDKLRRAMDGSKRDALSLVAKNEQFEAYDRLVEGLDSELNDYESALRTLEEIDDQFK